MTGPRPKLPAWIDIGVIPVANVLLAFLAAGLIVLAIGVNPLEAVQIMLVGALGYPEAIGYTLYYTTNFIFTGLAVAVAFHAGLFNIGGEGQAYIGGLCVGLACLALGGILPFPLMFVFAILAGAAFGAAWAYVPGWLQAKRGSHVVITTIMFNFIASALMTYIMVYVLILPGQQSPESRGFDPSTFVPTAKQMLGWIGIEIASSPLNLSFAVALIAAAVVWVFIWYTHVGYELRVVGKSERAAVYSGISPDRHIILAMAI